MVTRAPVLTLLAATLFISFARPAGAGEEERKCTEEEEKEQICYPEEEAADLELLARCPDGLEKCADVPLEKLYHVETRDGGDDPFTPSCHREYDSKELCEKGGETGFYMGDVCQDAVNLVELTASPMEGCHPMFGSCPQARDCNKLCQKLELGAGHCERVKAACDIFDSAMCVCEKGSPKDPDPT